MVTLASLPGIVIPSMRSMVITGVGLALRVMKTVVSLTESVDTRSEIGSFPRKVRIGTTKSILHKIRRRGYHYTLQYSIEMFSLSGK